MSTTTTLKDGRTVTIRRMTPTDGAVVAAVLERMSADARHNRFLRPMPRISRQLVKALTPDGVRHLAVVAHEDGLPAGMARIVITDAEAELAVEVCDDFAGVGLGRCLTQAILAEAAGRGVTAVGVVVAVENTAARRLFTSLGAGLRYENGALVGSLIARRMADAA